MGAITFKCPYCGGELTFNPSAQNYICEYCDSQFTQAQLDEMTPMSGQEQHVAPPLDVDEDEPVSAAAQGNGPADTQGQHVSAQTGENAVLYSCPSCGAQIVTDETTAATFCYYCHNPVVLEGRLSGDYLPDQIIPFQIDHKAAEQKFFDYVRSKKFVPKAFFSKSQLEKLSGVYYPYWLYDSELSGQMEGEGSRIRVWRTGDTEYTETSIYHIQRGGDVMISNLTRNALKKTNRELVENVQPYQLEKMTDFNMGYLSGFVAEKRDMEKDSFSDELHQQTEEYARDLIRATTSGYTGMRTSFSQFSRQKERWHYALLPVWVLTYRSMGQLYYFAMNGQTGQIAGKLPIDRKKLGMVSAGFGLAAAVICLIGGYLL